LSPSFYKFISSLLFLIFYIHAIANMGGSSSKAEPSCEDTKKKEDGKDELNSFADRVRATIEDEIARKAMVQRKVQLAVNIAKARDNIWIFGSAWAALVTGAVGAKAAGRTVPPFVGVPVVVGALVLGNMADMAYGNKLNRVVKEAEYILENEKGRFVPFKQVCQHDCLSS